MKNITIPISTSKKILGSELWLKTAQKVLATAEQPLSSLTGTASGSVGSSTRGTGKILEGAETDAGTNGVTPKLNDLQQSDAKLVAKLPSDFPIQEWDSMSTKAQQRALMFSGLTEQEQWALLNPSAPLSVLAQAAAEQKVHIDAHAEAKMLPASDSDTETPKTTPLQPKGSAGESGGDTSVGSVSSSKVLGKTSVSSKPVLEYPAIAYFVDSGDLNSTQKSVLARAQVKLVLLNKNGTPTQQQIDEVLADSCTRLLNGKNAPTNDNDIRQTKIPAYTNAVDNLLTRLRADGNAQQEELRQMALHSGINQSAVYSSLVYQLIEFKQNSEEDGALNLRSESKWNDLITQYSPEATTLNGSQYLFVYNGDLLSVEDLGNAIFGYYGSAMGLPTDLLYIGAGYAAVAKANRNNTGSSLNIFNGYMGDSPEDRAMIDLGIFWYLEGK